MSDPVVILHGWSDDSKSFVKLQSFLADSLPEPPVMIRLADWISLLNDVTYADIATAMERAWKGSGLPSTPRSTSVIVHSTGALITRDWMTRHYTPETVPIKRLVMLAPANFGSHLAHKGRSFIGRALKGWGQPGFQTGDQILKGLELASPYTFHLAERDLFDTTARWYGKNRILATVLVGNKGYSGITALANEDGSDGTVRISTANLNSARLELVLDKAQKATSRLLTQSNGAIAFGIMDGENHSTIAFKDRGPANPRTGPTLLRALAVEDADYADTGSRFPWQTEIDAADPAVAVKSDRFQNTVTWLNDDLGHDVKDYFVEFYRKEKEDNNFEQRLYEKLLSHVHPYQDNPAYRALYLNIDNYEKLERRFKIEQLYMSLMASPVYNPPLQPVGYMALGEHDVGGLVLDEAARAQFFQPHRTLLVQVTISRAVGDEVFQIH